MVQSKLWIKLKACVNSNGNITLGQYEAQESGQKYVESQGKKFLAKSLDV